MNPALFWKRPRSARFNRSWTGVSVAVGLLGPACWCTTIFIGLQSNFPGDLGRTYLTPQACCRSVGARGDGSLLLGTPPDWGGRHLLGRRKDSCNIKYKPVAELLL